MQSGTPHILHRHPTLSVVEESVWAPSKIMPTDIYQGHFDNKIRFRPVAKKVLGDAIGTIYKLGAEHARWIGKVGKQSPYLTDDSSSHLTRKQIDLSTTLEKIAADFFAYLQNKYRTPETCLSLQIFLDEFTKENEFAQRLANENQIENTLRIMSKFVDGFQDLASATTKLEGKSVSIEDFIIKCHRPPEEILSPENKLIPLKGMMELCAAIRLLADIDGLGGELTNAGFVWEKKGDEITSARVVKIDPEYAFEFALPKNGSSRNLALLTAKQAGYTNYWLSDIRDIQVSNQNRDLNLHWNALTEKQKATFLEALKTMIKKLETDPFYGFYRKGVFTSNIIEGIPENVACLLSEQMSEWVELQKKIYDEGLTLREAMFHYPPPLASFIGRKTILTKLTQKLTSSEKPVALAVLCGSEGIGKSELASYFAFKKRKIFSLIYWLQCDSETHLLNSYLSLAEFLQLTLHDTSSLEAIRTQVHNALNKRSRWLLIFDNVDNVENSLPLPEKGGSVLITSQKESKWHPEDVIEVPPLIPIEAAKLIQNITQQTNSNASIQELAEKLGRVPLFISHAAASIREQGVIIEDYLKQVSFSEGNPLLNIWKSVFAKIEQKNPKAFEWLIICSYFNFTDISTSWLRDWIANETGLSSKEASKKALKIISDLKDYHLIQLDKQRGMLSIHKLLHNVLRTYQQKTHYESALKILANASERFNENKPVSWERERQWYAHAEYFSTQKNTTCDGLNAYIFFKMGLIAGHLHLFSEALKHHQKALQTVQEIHGETAHPSIANSYDNVGNALRSLGNFKEALSSHQKALEMLEKIHEGTPHPDIADCYDHIGNTLSNLHNFKEALMSYKKALKMRYEIYGAVTNSEIASSLNNIGKALSNLQRPKQALVAYIEALEMWQNIWGTMPHNTIADCLNNMGNAFFKLYCFDDALTSHQEALEMKYMIYGKKKAHLDIANSLNNIGNILVKLNRFDDALISHQNALKMRDEIYGEKASLATAGTLEEMGNIFSRLDKKTIALSHFQKALKILEILSKIDRDPSIKIRIERLKERINLENNMSDHLPLSAQEHGTKYSQADSPENAKIK